MPRWEYEAYVYDRGSSQLKIRRGGQKREPTWAGMWAHFDELGAAGWEMISAIWVSDARRGNPEGNTTRMLFAFERRRAARLRHARNIVAECAAIQSPTARQPRGESIPAAYRWERLTPQTWSPLHRGPKMHVPDPPTSPSVGRRPRVVDLFGRSVLA